MHPLDVDIQSRNVIPWYFPTSSGFSKLNRLFFTNAYIAVDLEQSVDIFSEVQHRNPAGK